MACCCTPRARGASGRDKAIANSYSTLQRALALLPTWAIIIPAIGLRSAAISRQHRTFSNCSFGAPGATTWTEARLDAATDPVAE